MAEDYILNADESEVNVELKTSVTMQSTVLIRVKSNKVKGVGEYNVWFEPWTKVVRVLAYVKRFIGNCKDKATVNEDNT